MDGTLDLDDWRRRVALLYLSDPAEGEEGAAAFRRGRGGRAGRRHRRRGRHRPLPAGRAAGHALRRPHPVLDPRLRGRAVPPLPGRDRRGGDVRGRALPDRHHQGDLGPGPGPPGRPGGAGLQLRLQPLVCLQRPLGVPAGPAREPPRGGGPGRGAGLPRPGLIPSASAGGYSSSLPSWLAHSSRAAEPTASSMQRPKSLKSLTWVANQVPMLIVRKTPTSRAMPPVTSPATAWPRLSASPRLARMRPRMPNSTASRPRNAPRGENSRSTTSVRATTPSTSAVVPMPLRRGRAAAWPGGG